MPGAFITKTTAWQLGNRVISSWKMEESSGNRVDSAPTNSLKTAANDLVPTNTPGNTTGIIGNAVSLVLASSQSLQISSNSSLQMGSGIRMTLAFWIKFTTVVTNQAIINKQSSGPTDEYRVILSTTAIGGTQPGFSFGVSSAGTIYNTSIVASNYGVVAAGSWLFVVCKYDGSNISISVNNGTPNTASFTADIFSGAAPFNVGFSNLVVTNYVNGAIDDVTLWKRALTAEEITYLYNGGVGRQWQFVGVASILDMFFKWPKAA